MKPASRLFIVPFVSLALLATACGSSSTSGSAATTSAPSSTSTTAAAVQGSITVLAATSLTEAFNQIGAAFTKANSGAKVTFSFDASSALVQQIIQGAPADVFASADNTNMGKLTKAGLNGTPPALFATNLLGIIVPAGNPKGITGVQSLAQPGLKVVLCAVQVPCGQYAKQIVTTAGVSVTPVSYEQNVKGVVTKVTTGEADAGIVYVTDISAAGSKAAGVDIPKNLNVVADYPIASVKSSKNQAVDQAFIKFVLGPDGQAILARYGFLKP